MTHAGFVWANLRRRPLQSFLGLCCATLAFAVYGLMFGLAESFRQASIQNATFERQLLVGAVVVSVIGMTLILLLTAAATAHAVRLRLYEFGVLKALGFSHRRIIALVVAEAASPCVTGAALGLFAAPLLFATLASLSPAVAMLPPPEYTTAMLAAALGIVVLIPLLSGVLPALRIVRLDAATALTGSAEAPLPVRVVDAGTPRSNVSANPSSVVSKELLASAANMPGLLWQIVIVARIGFSTLHERLRGALLIMGGVGCVVLVLLWFLSMAEGIRTAILGSGDPARVVLRATSTAWLQNSRLPEGVAEIAANTPGVARGADGGPLAEAAIHGVIRLVRLSKGRGGGISIVGVGPHWREMTPNFHLLSGRLPRPGTSELIVGQLAQRAFSGLNSEFQIRSVDIGKVDSRGAEWQVVGTFATDDWWDGFVVGEFAALKRHAPNLAATAVLVKLISPQSFEAFRSAVTLQLPPSVTVEREADFYAAFWRSLPKAVLYIAFVLGALLATGAVAGTTHVMHNALEERRREIATLRVLGFDGRAVAASLMLESMLFAVLGAWLAAGLIWLWRDGDLWVGAWSVFEFTVDLQLLFVATGWAVAITLIGALPLTLRTLRRREMETLQDL